MVNADEMAAIAERAGWKLTKTCGPRNLYIGVLTKK
jgi:hypothetical protein